MQDRCTVCTECTKCSEINLDAPDELLDDVCHMESHFDPFGDSVRFGARLVHGLRLMHPRSTIRCVQNGFLSYGVLGANCAPILHRN